MDAAALKYVLKCIGCLGLYMFFSISLTFYQKDLLKELRFPLSIVLAHLTLKFLLAALVRNYLECTYDTRRSTLAWQLYWRRLAAPGICSALDIGLSQWSIEFITITLYTMTKSTSVIFIYICALIYRLERLQCSMVLVVALISIGLSLFTFETTSFSLFGFLMALSASACSGVRWTLSQKVMNKQELGLANPIDMIYHIQPWMIITVLPFAVFFEGVPLATSTDFFLSRDVTHATHVAGQVLVGCLLAFCMDSAEFLSLRVTSSVTLCVASVFKEVCTLGLDAVVNGGELNPLKVLGLLICVSGILGHAAVKVRQLRDSPPPDVSGVAPELQLNSLELPLLPADGTGSDDDFADEDVLFQIHQ